MSVSATAPTGPENPDYVRWVKLPTRQEAFEAGALATLSANLDIPEQEVTPSALEAYKGTLRSTHAMAEMVNIHISNRLWPTILEASEAQPEFSIEYRGRGNLGERAIKNVDFYRETDLGKFLLAAAQFDRPEGAMTVKELAAELRTTPYRLDQFLLRNEIATRPYRHPEAAEFDEFIPPEVVGAISRAVSRSKRRRAT